ncbi:nucleoside-diphosphate kinase [Trypanosoma rangeli]|uniref:Nucleoside-diphosphate kinase n=1 Tax=Trypanosoma rangeli TaxID=5698 RepID=A0A422NGD0_TRYRA|nr:nucleoside-diphosphate kinase [Trypanosoma rangeli]RNF04520.1 nucleoside-diphosphate kinase [Trypanosoma rangeli]|eukprot:RNF04520.1 nucleoside-diphosphate kinase [Trypanosoma rangeli]
MASALSGVVSKAALFVRSQYAQERELLSMIKFKLCEAGFIIVYEEYRRINEEMADTIGVQLDRAAFLSGSATPLVPSEPLGASHPMFTCEHATSLPTGVQELVGHVYLYVLARRDCHTELLRFLDHVFADADFTSLLMSIQEKAVHDDANTATATKDREHEAKTERPWIPCPLFCNAAAVATKQVVQLLFPRMLVQDVPTTAASREYVQAELKGTLLPALVELSKAKPENPIRWLAERLLNTNTRAPPLIPASSLNGTS